MNPPHLLPPGKKSPFSHLLLSFPAAVFRPAPGGTSDTDAALPASVAAERTTTRTAFKPSETAAGKALCLSPVQAAWRRSGTILRQISDPYENQGLQKKKSGL
jgi:hypothetical protein